MSKKRKRFGRNRVAELCQVDRQRLIDGPAVENVPAVVPFRARQAGKSGELPGSAAAAGPARTLGGLG